MFLKKKKNSDGVSVEPVLSEKIHTMPQKFYVSRSKGSNKILFLLIGGLVVIIAVVIFIAIFLSKTKYSIDKNQPLSDSATNSVEPVNTNSNADSDVNLSINSNVNTVINARPDSVPESNLPDFDLTDIDGDGLNAEEEKLLFTSTNSRDTDSDSFDDLSEVLAGYDPRLAGKKIEESDLVKRYVFSEISFLLPVLWQAIPQDSMQKLILDSKTGDTIGVSEENNPENLEPLEWLEAKFPGFEGGKLNNAELKNAVIYSNSLKTEYHVFLKNNDKVYNFSYLPANVNAIIFPSILQVIVNSIKI